VLSLNQIQKSINGIPLYESVSFQILPGEKVGVVGPNGAGKTTLFRLIVGEDKADTGAISFPSGMRMSYFSQKSAEMRGRSALEEVMSGDAKLQQVREEISQLEEQLNTLYSDPSDKGPDENELQKILDRLGDAQTEFEKRGGYDLEQVAQETLSGLGLPPESHYKQVEEFSSGQKMRIALARTLVVRPDLILMDEPTNYLDLETIEWLESWLKQFKGSILLTTHDREFMNRVVTKIIEISGGESTVYTGNYEFYLKEKAIRIKQLESQFQSQQAMLKKEEEFIAEYDAEVDE